MRVHTYERAFLTVGIAVILSCMGALVYASTARGIHLPGHAGTIAPAQVYKTEPFRHPGVRQTGPGRYEAAIVAQAWAFNPQEIRVPAGAEVTFTATSVDILHGFEIEGTRVNMMLIPGQVSRAAHTFRAPGTYLLICHEYCGLGHHTMYGKVIVE